MHTQLYMYKPNKLEDEDEQLDEQPRRRVKGEQASSRSGLLMIASGSRGMVVGFRIVDKLCRKCAVVVVHTMVKTI